MKLLTCIAKELLLLFRDMTGLLLIFMMPVALVVVVTLVQENAMRAMGESRMKMIFVDLDHDTVGKRLNKMLDESSSVEIIKHAAGKEDAVEEVRKTVAKGAVQFAVIVPRGTTKAFLKRARTSVQNSIVEGRKKKVEASSANERPPDLTVFFDPATTESGRKSIVTILEKALLGIEIEEKMKILSDLLPVQMKKEAKKAMGQYWSDDIKIKTDTRLEWEGKTILTVRDEVAQLGLSTKIPDAVQQNVPAWTLFGMFFIVVPLAGSLIRERQSGMLLRLRAMPVSPLTIMTGKIVSYVIICLIQLIMIMAVGMYVLPLFGTTVLDIGSSPAAIVLITFCAALAASGYGILLGTVARTYEQASMFGAVSVVIAAALGGIMVPTFVMPRVMQNVSLFSPLAWGHRAFLEVFIRGGGMRSVLPYVALLLLFFLVTTFMAWFYIRRRGWT